MSDLVEFLRARLAEDEAGVRALTVPHEWHTGPGDDPDWTDEELVCMWPPEFHTPYEQDKHWRGITISGPELASYMARHDPARVLREVTAKQELVNEYAKVADNDINAGYEYAYGWANGLGFAIRCLAAAYADHPDYQAEWAPTA